MQFGLDSNLTKNGNRSKVDEISPFIHLVLIDDRRGLRRITYARLEKKGRA